MLPVLALAVPSSGHPVVIWGLKFVTVLDQTPACCSPVSADWGPPKQGVVVLAYRILYEQVLLASDIFFTDLSIISLKHTSKKENKITSLHKLIVLDGMTACRQNKRREIGPCGELFGSSHHISSPSHPCSTAPK